MLRELYSTTPVKKIAAILKRAPESVKDAARSRGIKSLPRKAKTSTLYYYDGKPKFRKKANGCWEWTASKNKKGYGLCNGEDSMLAHVQVYVDTYGPVPDGMEVDHTCSNRPCVNPDHLEAVTHQVNIQRGSKTKLTAKDVIAIRRSLKRLCELARKYGVAPSTIDAVRTGKTWKNLSKTP